MIFIIQNYLKRGPAIKIPMLLFSLSHKVFQVWTNTDSFSSSASHFSFCDENIYKLSKRCLN